MFNSKAIKKSTRNENIMRNAMGGGYSDKSVDIDPNLPTLKSLVNTKSIQIGKEDEKEEKPSKKKAAPESTLELDIRLQPAKKKKK